MRNSILFLLMFWCFSGCINSNKEEMIIKDIDIFKDSPVWELAKLLEKGNVREAKKLVPNDKDLLNFKDPYFGTTLLMRYVSVRNQEAVNFLIDNGADVNIVSATGSTALFRAISYSWKDVNADKDPKFVELLLSAGANPNITYCGNDIEGQTDPVECGTSPLMHSIARGIEKTNLLLEAGADINYKTKTKKTAAIKALMSKSIDAAYVLIVDMKAKVDEPYYFYSITNPDKIETDKPHYPVDLLLDWILPLGSPEYEKKMAIVGEFNIQGIDYQIRKADISNLTLRRIQKIYPDNWVEYVKEF